MCIVPRERSESSVVKLANIWSHYYVCNFCVKLNQVTQILRLVEKAFLQEIFQKSNLPSPHRAVRFWTDPAGLRSLRLEDSRLKLRYLADLHIISTISDTHNKGVGHKRYSQSKEVLSYLLIWDTREDELLDVLFKIQEKYLSTFIQADLGHKKRYDVRFALHKSTKIPYFKLTWYSWENLNRKLETKFNPLAANVLKGRQ